MAYSIRQTGGAGNQTKNPWVQGKPLQLLQKIKGKFHVLKIVLYVKMHNSEQKFRTIHIHKIYTLSAYPICKYMCVSTRECNISVILDITR